MDDICNGLYFYMNKLQTTDDLYDPIWYDVSHFSQLYSARLFINYLIDILQILRRCDFACVIKMQFIRLISFDNLYTVFMGNLETEIEYVYCALNSFETSAVLLCILLFSP